MPFTKKATIEQRLTILVGGDDDGRWQTWSDVVDGHNVHLVGRVRHEVSQTVFCADNVFYLRTQLARQLSPLISDGVRLNWVVTAALPVEIGRRRADMNCLQVDRCSW